MGNFRGANSGEKSDKAPGLFFVVINFVAITQSTSPSARHCANDEWIMQSMVKLSSLTLSLTLWIKRGHVELRVSPGG